MICTVLFIHLPSCWTHTEHHNRDKHRYWTVVHLRSVLGSYPGPLIFLFSRKSLGTRWRSLPPLVYFSSLLLYDPLIKIQHSFGYLLGPFNCFWSGFSLALMWGGRYFSNLATASVVKTRPKINFKMHVKYKMNCAPQCSNGENFSGEDQAVVWQKPTTVH